MHRSSPFLRVLLLASIAAAATPGVARAAGEKPAAVPERELYRPTAVPDRIVLTWTGDPATSQAVSWRTDIGVTRAVAQLALAAEKKQEATREVAAATARLETDLGPAHFHAAEFEQLAPATLYAYRVGDGTNWSEWFQFRTAAAEARPFTFLYFGDAQNELKAHWSRVAREAFREAPRAAFTLHAGDLVNRTERDAEWGEWFGAPGWVNGTIPVVPTPGNHEYYTPEGTGAKRTLGRHWRPQFALPLHGPPGLEESVYYLDYQGARIISLNSNEQQEAQVPWLRAVLQNNPQRWTLVTFHHPIFSPARNRDNPKLRALWKPVFDEFKVDLVLTGHDHTYARSGDVSALRRVGTANVPEGYNQVYDPAIGTVYVVSVSGPKMYDITNDAWAVRTGEDTQLFQVITVSGDELHFEARTATNRLYDTFTLRKRPGAPNELLEALPREFRRPAK